MAFCKDEWGIRQQQVASPEGLFDEHGGFNKPMPLPEADSTIRAAEMNVDCLAIMAVWIKAEI